MELIGSFNDPGLAALADHLTSELGFFKQTTTIVSDEAGDDHVWIAVYSHKKNGLIVELMEKIGDDPKVNISYSKDGRQMLLGTGSALVDKELFTKYLNGLEVMKQKNFKRRHLN